MIGDAEKFIVFLIDWVTTTFGVFLAFGAAYWAFQNPDKFKDAEWTIYVLMALGIMLIARHAPKTK